MREIKIYRVEDDLESFESGSALGDKVEVTAHEDELTIAVNSGGFNEVVLVLPQWVMDYIIPAALAVQQYGSVSTKKQPQ